MAKVKIVSNILEGRGNSWDFENRKERVYFEAVNPSDEELANGMDFANAQYEAMGWSKCFVEPPKVVAEAV